MKGLAYFLGGKVYDFLDKRFERTRYENIRKKILSKIKGSVLEPGCGTGRNLMHYPSDVSVVAFDNSKRMLNVAKARAKRSKADIIIKRMDITKINFPDDTFDNIVATFVLCVLPEKIEMRALSELVRVAKPNAKLYFLDYVYSKNKVRRGIMKITSFIPKLLFSIRFNTTYHIIKNNAFLRIEEVEYVYDDVVRLIVARKK